MQKLMEISLKFIINKRGEFFLPPNITIIFALSERQFHLLLPMKQFKFNENENYNYEHDLRSVGPFTITCHIAFKFKAVFLWFLQQKVLHNENPFL